QDGNSRLEVSASVVGSPKSQKKLKPPSLVLRKSIVKTESHLAMYTSGSNDKLGRFATTAFEQSVMTNCKSLWLVLITAPFLHSLTQTEKTYRPTAVGVPVSKPVSGSRLNAGEDGIGYW